MKNNMTEEEKDMLISIIQMGVVCGLRYPSEWYANYMMHNSMFLRYEDIPEQEDIARKAFSKFLNGCACCDNDPVKTITPETIDDYIANWYNKEQKKP